MHVAEIILRLGVALRCSEPKQPPRLGKVYRTSFAVVVHVAEYALRLGVALRCSEPKLLPRLGKVLRSAMAVVVHAAEFALRTGIALRCSEAQLSPLGLKILARVAHGVPDERGELRSQVSRTNNARKLWGVKSCRLLGAKKRCA